MSQLDLRKMLESEIWDHFKSGNQQAFAIIYDRFHQDLLTYGYKLSNDKEMVRDATHDLFVDIWKHRQNLADTENIKYYLLKGLRREIVRSLKNRKKFDFDSIDNPVEFDFTLSHESILVKEESERDLLTQIKKHIDKLSSRVKEILYLKFFEGMAYEEIAVLTDMKYQSVVNTVYRAMKGIRENLSILLVLIITPFFMI
jgi:RNA polymerase sigma factor (sigma-70 family)